jgi:hypothetical protein
MPFRYLPWGQGRRPHAPPEERRGRLAGLRLPPPVRAGVGELRGEAAPTLISHDIGRMRGSIPHYRTRLVSAYVAIVSPMPLSRTSSPSHLFTSPGRTRSPPNSSPADCPSRLYDRTFGDSAHALTFRFFPPPTRNDPLPQSDRLDFHTPILRSSGLYLPPASQLIYPSPFDRFIARRHFARLKT